MPKQVYRFEILERLPNGLYAATDEASQSRVFLYESTAEDALKPGFDKTLTEMAALLSCEMFSAGANRYLVATTEQQGLQLSRDLLRAGFLSAPEASVVKPRARWVPGLIAVASITATALALYFYLAPPKVVLRLEGSTTIGDELAPRLLVGFLNHKGARDAHMLSADARDKAHHDVEAILPNQTRPVVFSILANGSGNAFTALRDHRADIGMSSRPVNDAESGFLGEVSLRSPRCESVLALDGLAIIVNEGNPLEELTREQLGQVFRGTIRDWAQLGGRPGPIHLYGRKSDSGTFDTFAALVLKGDKNGFAKDLTALKNGDEITAAVSTDQGAIGYVGLAQIRPAKPLQISDGRATESLLPSPFTVGTEDYILSRRLFLYTPAQPTELAREFVDWAAGPEGQEIVESVGFVKQTPTFETPAISSTAPAAYRARTAGMRRMSVNFRFQTNSELLDNKALADLPRIQAALFQDHVKSGIQVFGFADNKGAPFRNQQLSERRAKVIADKLRAYGFQNVEATGFSSAMPVGDNNTDIGKDKNRRVEIWVK